MNYKFFFLIFLLLLSSCVSGTYNKQNIENLKTKNFINKGFALIYSDKLYQDKTVNGKIENRSLIIFQKDLKKNSSVKVTNLNNSKYIIATVGNDKKYPNFYNSVLSQRIVDELEIDASDPYVEIKVINQNLTFVAKKAKTFDEEKVVANKAPIDNVSVNNLNSEASTSKITKKNKFNYSIKVADFYFKESANVMIEKISKQSLIKNAQIKKISNTQYRVFLGPYKNLNSLKMAFNDIHILQFENIELIKND